ncbi:hypothetical protein K461DRAFT_47300 [Myriangium duriaei CBS 260.36]|uniref:Uncharacterized protein n=1 Tax=Myriangium duriaei CBS 260.36 TaxID=1168546 RepID=A0A9P4IVY7_9PEZI|nr:hypothetical protein K461DRAFT_47300 [Myriangium duriaei CBS 260.36]
MPVNTTGLRALCWSILFGVDKIPDKWFEKIPYYQSEEVREQKKKRSKKDGGGRRRRSSVDDRDRSDDEQYRSRHERRHGRRRSQDDYGSDDDYDDERDRRRRDRDYSRRHDDSLRGQNGSANGEYARPRHSQVFDPAYDPRRHSGSPHPLQSPHSAGYQHAYPPVGPPGGVAPHNGYPENYSPTVAGGYQDYRRGSGPAARGYVPYAHIYSEQGQPGPNSSRRTSRTYDPAGYDGGRPAREATPDYRGRERRRDDRGSDSHGSDESRKRDHRRHSRA